MDATFLESKCSFDKSSVSASVPHNTKTDINAAKKLLPKGWGIEANTTSVVIAKLHQGKENNPAANASRAVRNIDVMNFAIRLFIDFQTSFQLSHHIAATHKEWRSLM